MSTLAALLLAAGIASAPAALPAAENAAPVFTGAPRGADGDASAREALGGRSDGGNVLLPAVALLSLAAVAFLVSKRRVRGPGMLRVVDSASLGPKRSVVVVRVEDELLILGASEGGISLLDKRPAPPVEAPETYAEKSRFEEILARIGGER